MVEQFRGLVLDKAVSLSAALKPSLRQSHRRVKKPSICEGYCGVSISDKSAPQKYRRIMYHDERKSRYRERTLHVDTQVHYLRELAMATLRC
jgi:hypothetical protein